MQTAEPVPTRIRLCIRMRDPDVQLCKLLTEAFDQGCAGGLVYSVDRISSYTMEGIRAELQKIALSSGEDIPWAERRSPADHVSKINQFILRAAGHAWLECSTNVDEANPPTTGSIWHWLPDSRRNLEGGNALPDAGANASAPSADQERSFVDFLIEWFGWLRPPINGNRRKPSHEMYRLRLDADNVPGAQAMRTPVKLLMRLREGGSTYTSSFFQRSRALEDVYLTDLHVKFPHRADYEMPPSRRDWSQWKPQGFNCLSWAAELFELAVDSGISDPDKIWETIHRDFVSSEGPQNKHLTKEEFIEILKTGAINQLLSKAKTIVNPQIDNVRLAG